jgi:MarR family transcriptional regulator for hemolysin
MSNDVERLGFLVNETARAWRTQLDQRLKPLGLSIGKWTTLAHLARGGDKLTQKEIAARVGIEEPTLAGILDRLQQDGWIKRKNADHDRRCKTVHLQKRAARVLDEIFGTAHELRRELLADLKPKDLEACARVLSHIRDRACGVSQGGVQRISERRNGSGSLKARRRS